MFFLKKLRIPIANQILINSKRKRNRIQGSTSAMFALMDRNNLWKYDTVNNILNQYPKQESIVWEHVRNSINQADPKIITKNGDSIDSLLINTFIRFKLIDTGMAYYKNLCDIGVKLTSHQYTLLLKLIHKDKEKIKSYKDLIANIYNELRPYIKTYPVVAEYCAEVFGNFENYYKDMITEIGSNIECHNVFLTQAAFNFNEPERGFELLYKNPNHFHKSTVQVYFDYVIRMAKENKFSHSMVEDIVKFCSSSAIVIPHPELFTQLESLIEILKSDPNYLWYLNKCEVDSNSCCSSCGYKLNSVDIDDEDFSNLKACLINDVMIKENVNIRTSNTELHHFLSFLEISPKYNVVIDGLNVLNNKQINLHKLVKNFKISGKKVLFIGRKHLKHTKLYAFLQKYCLIYLTDNRSDDDVFTLRAAMHHGKDVQLISGDHFRGYKLFLKNPAARNTFVKWQLSHQYFYDFRTRELIPPLRHSMLPQKTELPPALKRKDELHWHLPVQEHHEPRLDRYHQLKWICLVAVPRQKVSVASDSTKTQTKQDKKRRTAKIDF